MDSFSLKKKENGDLKNCFICHKCECGLPWIICRTSPHLKHKYISQENQRKLAIDLNDFLDWAEDYIWYVLPKEGKVKYPWIDFSRKVCLDKYFVDNNPDLQRR